MQISENIDEWVKSKYFDNNYYYQKNQMHSLEAHWLS